MSTTRTAVPSRGTSPPCMGISGARSRGRTWSTERDLPPSGECCSLAVPRRDRGGVLPSLELVEADETVRPWRVTEAGLGAVGLHLVVEGHCVAILVAEPEGLADDARLLGLIDDRTLELDETVDLWIDAVDPRASLVHGGQDRVGVVLRRSIGEQV